MTLHLTGATEYEAAWISAHLRQADKEEITLATGLPYKWVLEKSVENSKIAFTVRKEKGSDPIALFGVADSGMVTADLFGGDEEKALLVGSIWMVGTDDLDRNKWSLAKEVSFWIDLLGKNYDVLTNVIWNNNFLYMKWLAHNGFKLRDAIQYGPADQTFYPFYRLTRGVSSASPLRSS